jgi:hypothetical protein
MKKNLFFLGIILAFIFAGCNKPKITCEIIKPSPNATFEIGETVELAVVVNVENTTIDVVQVYLDDVGYDKKSFFPFNFQISTKNMEKGTHTIRVVAIANSGAKSEKTVSFSVVKYESPDFVSFSDGTFPKGWTYNSWLITSPGYDDDYAIRGSSYYTYNNYVSVVKTCDNNTKFIEFYALGEEGYWYPPVLRFYIDSQCIQNIQTTTSWVKYTFPIPAGEHTFTWMVSSSSDDGYVFLDAIRFFKEE